MKKFLCVVIITFSLFFVFTANAEILSFSVSSASINNGQQISLVWSSQNLSGVKIILPCIGGIKYFNESNAAMACDSAVSDLPTTGALNVGIVNLNTLSSPIQVKAVPKTAAGIYDESYPSYVSISVGPASTIITDFNASVLDIESGNEITFSWTSQYITGVNFMLSCPENVRITYEGDARTTLPCGTIVFTGDFGASGQAKFKFFNDSTNEKVISVSVVPAMGNGTYDATRSKSIEVRVRYPVPKVPKVKLYSTIPNTIPFGSSTVISWGGENIAGVNFIFSCVSGISATSSFEATSTLPCGTYAFSNNLPATSSIYLSFKNVNYGPLGISAKIVPFLSNNTYDTTRSFDFRLDILQEVVSVPQVVTPVVPASLPVTPPAALAPVLATSTIISPVIVPAAKSSFVYTFLKPLYLGLENDADVRTLQQILILEGVYSGPVTGNYYNLTVLGVKKFQEKYGIAQLGNVGPKTREKLNELYPAGGMLILPPPSSKPAINYTFQKPLYLGVH